MMHQGSTTFDGAKLVWKTWAPLKVKLFLWLAFKGRLRRHGLAALTMCHLCNLQQEIVHHLFVSCPFTVQVWGIILNRLGVAPAPPGDICIQEHWKQTRLQFPATTRKGADTLFELVSWHIWKERNARLFRGDSLDHQQLLRKIKTDTDMWVAAGAKSLGSLLGE